MALDGGDVLAWRKCPASVKRDLTNSTALLDVSEMVADAMAGMKLVVEKYDELLEAQVSMHVDVLLNLIAETAPKMPGFVKVDNTGQPTFAPMDDVLPYLVEGGYVRDIDR